MAKSKNKAIVASKRGRNSDGTFQKGSKLAGQKKWEKYSKIKEMINKVHKHAFDIIEVEVKGKDGKFEIVEMQRLDFVLDALFEKAVNEKDVHAIKEYLNRTVGPVRKIITTEKEENSPIAILSNIIDVTEVKDAVPSNDCDKKDKQIEKKD